MSAVLRKYEGLIARLMAMSIDDRMDVVRRFNNLAPEEQAQAMINAGPDGEEWIRKFEDMKNFPQPPSGGAA